AITRQAENIQIQAGYDASTSMARADRRAQDLGVQAGQISSLAGIRASQVKGLIDTRAGLAAALKGIEADKLFGQKNAAIGMDLTKLLTSVGAEKDAEATGISASQNLRQLYASTRGQYWSLAGGKIGAVLPDSSIIGRIGSAAGVGVQGYGISDVYDRQRQVTTDALHGFNGEGIFNPTGTNKNSFTAMEGQFRAFDDNLKGVQANQQVFADTRMQISREQTNAVIGGINQSANIQRDGVFQSNERQFQANQIRMDAQIQAQTITRAAAAEVTRINFENRLRQAIYDAAAKLIEKHLEQRF
ncbi:MAG TPA: hypothetical protein VJ302_07235, partial [Blastocatellia bacterium]|nr:hypothetical protein [Blastocatellia bacterium]